MRVDAGGWVVDQGFDVNLMWNGRGGGRHWIISRDWQSDRIGIGRGGSKGHSLSIFSSAVDMIVDLRSGTSSITFSTSKLGLLWIQVVVRIGMGMSTHTLGMIAHSEGD